MGCPQTRKALQILRITRGETMERMAARLGMTTSMLSAVERGKRRRRSLESFVEDVIREYGLADCEATALRAACARDRGAVGLSIRADGLDDATLCSLVRLARRVGEMDGGEVAEALGRLGVLAGEER